MTPRDCPGPWQHPAVLPAPLPVAFGSHGLGQHQCRVLKPHEVLSHLNAQAALWAIVKTFSPKSVGNQKTRGQISLLSPPPTSVGLGSNTTRGASHDQSINWSRSFQKVRHGTGPPFMPHNFLMRPVMCILHLAFPPTWGVRSGSTFLLKPEFS